jgi:hypothetical protein
VDFVLCFNVTAWTGCGDVPPAFWAYPSSDGGISFGSLADAVCETKIGAVHIGRHAAQTKPGSFT